MNHHETVPASTSAHALDPRYLPAVFQPFIRKVGPAPTITLIEHYGGTRVQVPYHADPSHALAQLLGFEAFERLVQEFGGDTIDVPLGTIAKRATRNARIKAGREAGETTASLARRFHLTERAIRLIVNTK